MNHNFASATVDGVVSETPKRIRGESVDEESVVARIAHHRSRRDGRRRMEATDHYLARFRGELAMVAERLEPGDMIVVAGALEQEPYRRSDGEVGVDVIIVADRVKFLTVGGRTREEIVAAAASPRPSSPARDQASPEMERVEPDPTIDYGSAVDRRRL